MCLAFIFGIIPLVPQGTKTVCKCASNLQNSTKVQDNLHESESGPCQPKVTSVDMHLYWTKAPAGG